MKYFKKLVGENVYLSPRNSSDVELFTKWLNDFETTDYIGRSGNIVTIESEKKYLEENAGAEASFVIVTLKEDKMIGTVSLEEINSINQTATLGIFIGDEENRNKGYGAETLRLILDYGFNYLNLNNIMLNVKSFNERAISCYKKVGFKEFGRRRQSYFLNGKYYDDVQMDILAGEFTGSYIKNKNV